MANKPIDPATRATATFKLHSDSFPAPPVNADGVGPPAAPVMVPFVEFELLPTAVVDADALAAACAELVPDAMAEATEALSTALLT